MAWGASALLAIALLQATAAPMNACPATPDEEKDGLACPTPGARSIEVLAEGAQAFSFCSRCPACWTGLRLQASVAYRVEILGEPIGWRDKDWSAASVEEALAGWHDTADLLRQQDRSWDRFWTRAASPFIWLSARTFRRVTSADWFQIFMVVRDDQGGETEPERLAARSQDFTPTLSGELYLFVNDVSILYANNRGRMTLRISAVGAGQGG